MKKIAVSVAGILSIAQLISAGAICTTGTLADYEGLGATGCTIGTNTVSGFNMPAGITGSTAIAPGSITVTPSGGTASPALMFSVSATATDGMLIEALINYSISGNQYTSDSIAVAGSSAGGNGAVTEIQNYCIGGMFDSTGVNNCSTGNANLLLLLGDGMTSTPLSGASPLSITNDFTLDSGGPGTDNSAAGGSVTNSFSASATSAVPEPATFSFCTGVLALGIVFFKRRSALLKKEEKRS